MAAEHLLAQMAIHSGVLRDQARMVSEELIRVAVLWSEMWNEALEEVGRMGVAYSRRRRCSPRKTSRACLPI